MARGPFQGTFQPNLRPTVVTAPDALVYINGDTGVIGCPQCNRTFDINKFITSVQVDLSVDSVPGSASISLSVPRHTIDDFYFDGNPVVTPMMEIEIFAKGYYLVEGIPQYYPIFWGLVTEVNDAYSAGEHTVSIHCADILKWWELTRMNVNPAYTAPSGQQGRSIFGNVFYGTNPYDVIWSLAQSSFGDVIIGTGSLISLIKEQQQRQTFDSALSDIMLYWEQRFQNIRNNLMLYGTNGVAIRGDTIYQKYSRLPKGASATSIASSAVRYGNGGPEAGQMVVDVTAANVTAFRTQFNNAGQINFWQSEYQTKLELANAAKEAIGFEFFMDVTGDIVFKPPFYNLDILANKPVSWIQDIDIIDWDFSESEAEVVTQITMQGSYGGNVDYGMPEECTPFTSVTDYHLLRKYGWRPQTLNSEFLGNPQLMFYQGLDTMDRLNSRRHRGTVNIPMRPELRLGFPVYVAPKDQIWYVSGISHNIAFGSRASTTLTLTAKRTKFIAPLGTAVLNLSTVNSAPVPPVSQAATNNSNNPFTYTSRQLSQKAVFTLDTTNAASLPATSASVAAASGTKNPYDPVILRHPKTGRIVGYPNVVMVYTRPFAPANSDLDSNKGQKPPGTNPYSAAKTKQQIASTQTQMDQEISAQTTDLTFDHIKDKYSTNRYQYGLSSAGVYVYAHDTSEVIGEILTLPSKNVQVTPVTNPPLLQTNTTSLIRPVSDERGFEVIGHYRYGRRISLRDGQLVPNPTGGANTAANVDFQLGLGGGLFETLNAQAQGLTAISSAYPNPADQIARLQPEDTQTAAIVNPDGTPQPYSNTGYQFATTAPLGSTQQAGSASVEATTLSRALTLAEMEVREPTQDMNDTKCPCLLGRSDLAFITYGYSVANSNPIHAATPDNTSLFNQGPGASSSSVPINVGQQQMLQGNVSTIQAQITQLQASLAASQAEVASTDADDNPLGLLAAQQQVTDLQNQITAANASLASANSDLQQVTSAGGSMIPSATQLSSLVNTFLANLYTTLDTPHTQFEKGLRGDYLPGGLSSADPASINPATPTSPTLAPPFSPSNRAALGDPNAIALAGSSAVNDLTQTWNTFGSQLKASAQRATLTSQISYNNTQLDQINTQITQLQQQIANTSATVFTPGAQPPATQIAKLQMKAQQLEQQIAQDQQELNLIPAPPTSSGAVATLAPLG